MWPALCQCLRQQLLLCALTFPLFPVFPSQAQTPREGWVRDPAPGTHTYALTNKTSDALFIDCGMPRQDLSDDNPPRLAFLIHQKLAPANSAVTVVTSALPTTHVFQVDEKGMVTEACRSCIDNFVFFWNFLWRSKSVEVRFSDGRAAKFSMPDIQRVLPQQACAADN
jgi:hypothetical protein